MNLLQIAAGMYKRATTNPEDWFGTPEEEEAAREYARGWHEVAPSPEDLRIWNARRYRNERMDPHTNRPLPPGLNWAPASMRKRYNLPARAYDVVFRNDVGGRPYVHSYRTATQEMLDNLYAQEVARVQRESEARKREEANSRVAPRLTGTYPSASNYVTEVTLPNGNKVWRNDGTGQIYENLGLGPFGRPNVGAATTIETASNTRPPQAQVPLARNILRGLAEGRQAQYWNAQYRGATQPPSQAAQSAPVRPPVQPPRSREVARQAVRASRVAPRGGTNLKSPQQVAAYRDQWENAEKSRNLTANQRAAEAANRQRWLRHQTSGWTDGRQRH